MGIPTLHYTTREQPRVTYPDGTVVPGRLVVESGKVHLAIDTPDDPEIHDSEDVHAVGRVLALRAAAESVPKSYQTWRAWIQARYAECGIASPTSGLGGGAAATILAAAEDFCAAVQADHAAKGDNDLSTVPYPLEVVGAWREQMARADGGASL